MPFRKKNILVCDDDGANREIVKALLSEKFNCVVNISENGLSGLEQIFDKKYDLVITDYMMPRFNGIQFAGVIKSMKLNIPFILMTKYEDITIVEGAYLNEFFDLLFKPLKKEELLNSAEMALKTPHEPILTEVRIRELIKIPIKNKSSTLFDYQEMHRDLGLSSQEYLAVRKAFVEQSRNFLDDLDKAFQVYDNKKISALFHMFSGSCMNIRANKLAIILDSFQKTIDNQESLTVSDISVLRKVMISTLEEIEKFDFNSLSK